MVQLRLKVTKQKKKQLLKQTLYFACITSVAVIHGADLIVVHSCTGRTSGYVASILRIHDKAGTLTPGSCKELCMVQLRLKITKQKTVAKATCTVCDSVLYQAVI